MKTWMIALAAIVLPATHVVAEVAKAPQEIRAQLKPKRFTTLAAEIGAKVMKLPYEEGMSFKAGSALVTFDCSIQQAQLGKANAALKAADKTWKANKRLDELNAVGKVELEVSESEMIKSRAEVSANAAVLKKCIVSAPFAGRVTEQKVREQQFVQPGQALLEIIDDSVLELVFVVPSKWLVWMKVGDPFQIKVDETAKTYPAKIQRIGAKVDPVSQTVRVTAAIDGRFPELISGMSGKVLITPKVQ
ncbi:efflux RND transporter periplasmic adaptor subunit [Leeia sp. TBRC 13508]|uniref:Efflux RND transporter periplasmic adaptor subunit n=1 Tax=Leeia speluncae TaxID=2884804 RepID=A0ABS8D2W1_9NEIS|nr:efflux RND transporter periplasmic adaptor subunit [Leeia speluncae]MCB6182509.1 efflux RND transporter periplasmic adaptor subunit [Leeia speluncae]